jgi:hypothetical protein
MVMRPFHRITVRFGPPVVYEHDGAEVATGSWSAGARATGAGANHAPGAHAPGQEELRALTDALMQAITTLSGQVYVDEYASRKRQPAPEAPATGAPAAEPSS